MKTRKRDPSPTGKGTLVGVRLQPADLKALDRWIKRGGKHQTHPQAVRELVRNGLAIAEITWGAASNRSPHAIELAGSKIDLLLNPGND
ncbi:hypothetical protein [Bradyrhizobium sp.]|jgi:hypothetical protein|uniref:hypothetical protein n=1 Tax=Bradyrhizobium sp. TaxID=376 RepID=UPI003D0DDD8D